MRERSRRQFLTFLSAGAISGLSGCGQGEIGYFELDGSPAETPPGDITPPEIIDTDASPTENAGELEISMKATDETALDSLAITVGNFTLSRNVPNQVEATIAPQILTSGDKGSIKPFEVNEVTFHAQDQADNSTVEHGESYIHKYDKMVESRLDIGAVYLPFAGDGLVRCLDEDVEAEPEVGEYFKPIPAEVTSQHIDQMTGHGIGRVLYDWEGRESSFQRVHEFLESSIIDRVKIEPYFASGALMERSDQNWKEEVFPRDFPFIRDNLMDRDNVATYRGRPALSSWGMVSFALEERYQEKIKREFGGYGDFVNEMRSHLRVDNQSPFLIAGIGPGGHFLQNDEDANTLVSQFDGVTTWFPGHIMEPGTTTEWSDVFEEVETRFQLIRQFTDPRDMEFVPMVFPGFDEEGNTCYAPGSEGKPRDIPRNVDRFRQFLKVADKYRTSNRINIATWNDWLEGHQIEPGSYRGTDYGTTYVDIIKEFQTS